MSCLNIKYIGLVGVIITLALLCGQATSEDYTKEQLEKYHTNTYEQVDLKSLQKLELPIGKKIGVEGFLLVDTSVRLAPTLESYLSFSEDNLLLSGASVDNVKELSGCYVYVAGEVQKDKYTGSRLVLDNVKKVTRVGAAYIGAMKMVKSKKVLEGKLVKCEIQALIGAMIY